MGAMKAIRPARMLPRVAALALCAAAAVLALPSRAATPRELLDRYAADAGAAADAARGQRLFTRRHGQEWSCSTCHGAAPVAGGRHAATGKAIAPLAPAFNAERFTDPARVEKWFRRNCRDVLARECSAGEKADVLAWLLTFKP
jgi:mono/diheme cytochrome c family protein